MFVEESIWIRNVLKTVPIQPGYEVVDVGSSNYEFRTKIQPHISENIFKPLEAKGCNITCLDIKNDVGVDIVADLSSLDLASDTFNKKYDLIICSNILEHVIDRTVFMSNMIKLVKMKGLMIITAPYKHYRHNDPIDTMYRPSTKDLVAFLQQFVDINIKKEETIKISERDYYVFKRGRLLDYFPYRTHKHLWRFYLRPFRWQVSCIMVEVVGFLY